MNLRFQDARLKKLEAEAGDGGFPPAVVSKFRMRVALIRAAADERDLYQLKSLHYEKLKGNRKHQRSMRLNDQWRLIVELEGEGSNLTVIVIGIEDYH